MEGNNAAALRDACQKMLDLLMLRGDGKSRCILTWDEFNESQKMLRAVLSAPRRNCDEGTADEQETRYEKFCCRHFRITDNGIYDRATGEMYHILPLSNVLAWAQMPYAEGGEK